MNISTVVITANLRWSLTDVACVLDSLQRDFIVQTGDPTGTGRGGESVFW